LRRKLVHTTLTAADFAKLAERARAQGQTVPRFLQTVALTQIGVPDPLLYQLALIGRDLEKLARLASASTPDLAAQLETALRQHRTLVQQLLTNLSAFAP
jgi:hypothetical protein